MPDPESVCAGQRTLPYCHGGGHYGEDLRREEGRLPVLPEGPAQDPLAAACTVDLGSIEKGDSQLQRAADDGGRLPCGIRVAVTPLFGSELPGAKSDF